MNEPRDSGPTDLLHKSEELLNLIIQEFENGRGVVADETYHAFADRATQRSNHQKTLRLQSKSRDSDQLRYDIDAHVNDCDDLLNEMKDEIRDCKLAKIRRRPATFAHRSSYPLPQAQESPFAAKVPPTPNFVPRSSYSRPQTQEVLPAAVPATGTFASAPYRSYSYPLPSPPVAPPPQIPSATRPPEGEFEQNANVSSSDLSRPLFSSKINGLGTTHIETPTINIGGSRNTGGKPISASQSQAVQPYTDVTRSKTGRTAI